MCGIAGVFTKQANVSERVILRMSEMLVHRGPDGDGLWSSDDRRLILAHRRLSIIDLTHTADQPMVSEDGNFIITYNGEIYNFLELKAECEELGSRFFTHSDTEVVLECYRHWGCDAFKKFTGMWAFAIYDKRKNELILSRDRFAIKPLYYGFLDGNFYFASEPKAFFAVDSRFKEVDEVSVKMFLDLGSLERGGWTFFSRIKRFPHAHYAKLRLSQFDNNIQFVRYWFPPTTTSKISYKDASNELNRLLKRSISLHMRSDVPVGACLSGGIDSSAIVSIASSGTDKKNDTFSTFTTHYPGYPKLDETVWAKRVIKSSGSKAYFAHPTYDVFVNEFSDLLYGQDEPFGSASIFAQYMVFRKIHSTNVKVVLDGQGPDEMLGGYHGFFPSYLSDIANRVGFLKGMLSLGSLYIRTSKYNQKSVYFLALKALFRNKLSKKVMYDKIKHFNASSEQRDTFEERVKYLAYVPDNFEELMSYMTCEANIPQLLRYEDRNSMHFSIESRVPFLEKEVVEFCLALPYDYRIRSGYTKAILRNALKGIVPSSILKRKDKMGFPAPEVEWLKKTFDVNVEGTASAAWREFCMKEWLEMLKTR